MKKLLTIAAMLITMSVAAQYSNTSVRVKGISPGFIVDATNFVRVEGGGSLNVQFGLWGRGWGLFGGYSNRLSYYGVNGMIETFIVTPVINIRAFNQSLVIALSPGFGKNYTDWGGRVGYNIPNYGIFSLHSSQYVPIGISFMADLKH